jgi:positive regulator of sigma E activity
MKLLTLILAMLVSVSTQIVSAQEPSPFYWEFIHVEIDVQENGDMLVTETQKYVFTASYSNKRYRWLPLDKVDSIENVEVFEGDRKLSVTTRIKKNQQWIRWQHALNPPESHTFVIKYRVKGGLQIDNSEDKVYWKAIFKERAAPILSGKVTVRLPAILAKKIRNFKSFGVPANARQIDTRTFEFVSRGAMPAGEEMEVLVTFPHGLLDVPLQKSEEVGFLIVRMIGLLLLALFILRFFKQLIFLVILAITVSLLFSGNIVLILIGLVLLLIVVWWNEYASNGYSSHGLLDVSLPKLEGIGFLIVRMIGWPLLLALSILRFFKPLIFLVILAMAVSLLFSGNIVLILIGLVLLLVVVWWNKYASNGYSSSSGGGGGGGGGG